MQRRNRLHEGPPAMPAGLPVEIMQEAQEHLEAVEALYDEVFGPGRYAKTAERLREGNLPIEHACFVGVDDVGLAGCVRLWPVDVGDSGRAALLGPLAVAPRRRGDGIAFRLMERAIEVCRAEHFGAVILVGDAPYYARAGFEISAPGRFWMPGPVDPKRILVRELNESGARLKGGLSVPRATMQTS